MISEQLLNLISSTNKTKSRTLCKKHINQKMSTTLHGCRGCFSCVRQTYQEITFAYDINTWLNKETSLSLIKALEVWSAVRAVYTLCALRQKSFLMEISHVSTSSVGHPPPRVLSLHAFHQKHEFNPVHLTTLPPLETQWFKNGTQACATQDYRSQVSLTSTKI